MSKVPVSWHGIRTNLQPDFRLKIGPDAMKPVP